MIVVKTMQNNNEKTNEMPGPGLAGACLDCIFWYRCRGGKIDCLFKAPLAMAGSIRA